MNRRTTLGGGIRTETSDPTLLAKVRAAREKLGVGEDVRVSDLSPAQIASQQMDEAKVYRDALESALAKLSDDFLKADADYKAKHRAYLSTQRRNRG